MSTRFTFGLDFGGAGVKVVATKPNGTQLDVTDLSGNDVFATAVFKDPKTGEFLYSQDALNAGIASPQDLAVDFKRFMGDDTKRFFRNTASARDVAVVLLRNVRERVAAAAGEAVVDCCVTTPFVWTDASATNYLWAQEQAGLKPIPAGDGGVGILREPTAAGVAYADLKKLRDSDVRQLVVDIGSTTTDVTYIEFSRGVGTVLGGFGDPNLGGVNIQNDFCDFVLNLARKEGLIKPAEATLAKMPAEHRLTFQKAIEEAMKALSNRPDTRVPISFGPRPGFVKVTASAYQTEILSKYVKRICDCVDQAKFSAIESGKLTPDAKVDYLVPVGGPNRNAFIRESIAKHVGLPAKTDVNAIRAIVIGAAKHAHWLMAQRNEPGRYLGDVIRPKDCVAHDVGVMTMESVGAPWRSMLVFKRGQTLPHTVTFNLALLEDHQTGVIIPFVQCTGDDRPIEECSELGTVVLENLPLEKGARTARIQITATFDEAGMVSIEVMDLISRQAKKAQISARNSVNARTAA